MQKKSTKKHIAKCGFCAFKIPWRLNPKLENQISKRAVFLPSTLTATKSIPAPFGAVAKKFFPLLDQKVFDVFYDALKGRQLLTYNALFKDANKLYKNKRLEKYKPKDETEYVWQILYRFYGAEKEEYNKLTDYEAKRAEKIAFNKAKIKQQWAKFHRVMEKKMGAKK